MQNTKLINYLSSLSKKEVKSFNDFIYSPYHNKSELIQQLWEYLKPVVPKFISKIEREEVIQYLYQEVTLNTNKRFNDLCVAFCKLFEEFITIEHLTKNKNYQTRLLVNAFGEHRLSKHFYKTIEKTKKAIQKKKIKDINDYEQLLFLETERYFYPETSKYDIKDNGMQVVLDTIYDYSYLLTVKNISEAKQIEMFVNRQFQLEKLYKRINIKEDTNNNLMKIYQLIIELINTKKQNWEIINRLINLFKDTQLYITNRDEKQSILNFIINYSSTYYSTDVRYYEVLFQHLKFGIESKLLIEKNALHEGYFINACIMSCELGYNDWLSHFLDNYKGLVKRESQEYTHRIGYINYLFCNKQFEEAIDLIAATRYEQLNLHLWYRTMELRCLYELYCNDETYQNIIMDKIEAFRRFCYRKKELSQSRTSSNFAFIKVYQSLLEKEHLSKSEITSIKEFIKTETIVCKLWLLCKF